MKRIFAVILTLACLFGLVACETNTSATTAKPKPTAAELKEKSSLSYVLSVCDGLLVTERMIGESYKTTTYFTKNDNGLIMSSTNMVDGEINDAALMMNGAVYQTIDTNFAFGIITGEDESVYASWDDHYGLPDLTDADPTVAYEGDTATLTVTVTDEYNDVLTYTYCANVTTLLPISMTIEVKDEEGTVYETTEITYTYPTDYSVDTTAYDAITGAKDAITLTVIIDPKGAATTRTYTVSASCYIMATGMTDEIFGAYSDSDCTEEIYDLSWVMGNSATIYVAPYGSTIE